MATDQGKQGELLGESLQTGQGVTAVKKGVGCFGTGGVRCISLGNTGEIEAADGKRWRQTMFSADAVEARRAGIIDRGRTQ